MEFQAQEPIEDAEPTPEQIAEALGETEETPTETPDVEEGEPGKEGEEKAETGEPSEPPEVVPEKKDEAEVKPPEGETKEGDKATEVYTKEQIDSLMKDRLTRFHRELQDENRQLQERLQSLEKPQQPEAASPIEQRDLGEVLQDEKWRGWSIQSLRDGGHSEQLGYALGRIGAKDETERMFKVQNAAQEERQRQQSFDTEISELKKVDATYFNEDGSVKGNRNFEELYTWGANNGVYNLVAAHKLKNLEAVIEKAKKDAVNDYVKEATRDPSLKRASTTESFAKTQSIDGMDDEALQKAYLDAFESRNPERYKAIEKKLEERGIM